MGKVLYPTVNDALDSHIVRIPEVSCWMWGGTMSKGYGTFSFRKKQHLAHRAMFEKHNGPLKKGLFVCHACDNPWCVNPDHLFSGTPNENMQDKVRKGRQSKGIAHSQSFVKSKLFMQHRPHGEKHGRSKLTDLQRMEILELLSSGESQRTIANRFDVSQGTISHTARKWNKVSYEFF